MTLALETDLTEELLRTSPAPGLRPADVHLLAQPPAVGEVRIRIEDLGTGSPSGCYPAYEPRWRVVVAAHDRRGLLATAAAVAFGHGLSIEAARGLVWPQFGDNGLALLELEVTSTVRQVSGEPDWTWIGQDLRAAICEGHVPPVEFRPRGMATVDVREIPELSATTSLQRRWQVSVRAPDATGLLAVIAARLAAEWANVEVAEISRYAEQGRKMATAEFVVRAPTSFARVGGRLAALISP